MPILTPEEIKRMRKKLRITQLELARLAGVSQAYIAKIEGGKADPKFSVLQKIARALESVSSGVSKSAKEIATIPVISVRPSDRVSKAIKLMEKKGISQLPVIEKGKQLGSISEGIVLRLLSSSSNPLSILSKRISSIMGEPFPIVDSSVPVTSVISLLEHSPAVLTAERDKIVGIITKADLFKLLTRT